MPATRSSSAAMVGGVSDEAVRKATGRTWKQWLTALDKAGCRSKTHKQIVAAVGEVDSEVSHWWQQMITVGYEQERGLRKKHEKPAGFEVSASRTIIAPVSKVYRAWSDTRTRRKWLDEPVEIRTSTKDKSIRLDWAGGDTRINVYFVDKGSGKCQVTAQHVKLPNARQAESAKAAWKKRLNALKAYLEE